MSAPSAVGTHRTAHASARASMGALSTDVVDSQRQDVAHPRQPSFNQGPYTGTRLDRRRREKLDPARHRCPVGIAGPGPVQPRIQVSVREQSCGVPASASHDPVINGELRKASGVKTHRERWVGPLRYMGIRSRCRCPWAFAGWTKWIASTVTYRSRRGATVARDPDADRFM